jgi:hypothetical protein
LKLDDETSLYARDDHTALVIADETGFPGGPIDIKVGGNRSAIRVRHEAHTICESVHDVRPPARVYILEGGDGLRTRAAFDSL